MADQLWHYSKNGQSLGPVNSATLKQLAGSGQLLKSDLVWTDGMAGWMPAMKVKGLFVLAPETVSIPVAREPLWLGEPITPPDFSGSSIKHAQAFGQTAPLGVSSATFATGIRRAGAYLIDYAVYSVCIFFVEFVLILLMGPTTDYESRILLNIVVPIAVFWLYTALMDSSVKQGTIGKMACGLFVTDLNGKRIGFGRASGRFFGMYLSGLILCVGFFMCGWTAKKQCLHDIMAGCLMWKK